MAIVQVNMKVSPNAYQELTDIKRELEAESGRQVTYSEVIERLSRIFRAKVYPS